MPEGFLEDGMSNIAEAGYEIDYVIRRADKPSVARIFTHDTEAGLISRRGDLAYVLKEVDGNTWTLDPRVNGEIRPFSLSVAKVERQSGETVLEMTIRDHLFFHDGKFYMFSNLPEGRSPGEFLVGKKYICRLDGFPFKDMKEVDLVTRSQLRGFRGADVGEFSGLGNDGHIVRLRHELKDIALPVAASCYILFTTG